MNGATVAVVIAGAVVGVALVGARLILTLAQDKRIVNHDRGPR